MIIHFAVPFAYTHISFFRLVREPPQMIVVKYLLWRPPMLWAIQAVQSASNFTQKKRKEIFFVVWFGFASGMMRIVRRRFSIVDKTNREYDTTCRFVNISHLDFHSFPLVRLFTTSIQSKWVAMEEDGARIKNDIISQLVKSINNAFTSKSFNVSTLNPVCRTIHCLCVCVRDRATPIDELLHTCPRNDISPTG